MTQEFNYEEFAQSMTQQAKEIKINDISLADKKYLLNILNNFTLMAGKTLAENEQDNFTCSQMEFVTQLVAEWTYHKTLDIIRAGIPNKHRDSILQKLAYTVFEVAKYGLKEGMPESDIIPTAEHNLNKCYKECLEDLMSEGVISAKDVELALSMNNIETMAMEMAEKEQRQDAAEALKITQNSVKPQNLMIKSAVAFSKAVEQIKKFFKTVFF